MELNEILTILPHKHPYLLIDRVIELEEGEKVVAVKGVTYSENLFLGHFPGDPILPGAVIIEAASQAAGLLVCTMRHNKEEQMIGYVTAVNTFKFKKKVKPGNLLVIEAVKSFQKGPFLTSAITVSVDNEITAEGELSLYVETQAVENSNSGRLA